MNLRLRQLLMVVAVAGLTAAWWLFPAENRFSIMRCTISFLGSPDADRNPGGWRFYQAGMSALVLLLGGLVVERHRRVRPMIGTTARWSSGAIGVALALLFLAVWIADTRETLWFGVRAGKLHTRMAILAIPFMGAGILLDGVALRFAGVPTRALWPFHLYGLLVLVGMTSLMAWKRMCARDATLRHWPGEGIHATPLWEWVVFVYLVGFLLWMARRNWTMPER
ncbi:MAG: hypothetical protein ABI680_05965 [Chthoniobacteraceae bacterium]